MHPGFRKHSLCSCPRRVSPQTAQPGRGMRGSSGAPRKDPSVSPSGNVPTTKKLRFEPGTQKTNGKPGFKMEQIWGKLKYSFEVLIWDESSTSLPLHPSFPAFWWCVAHAWQPSGTRRRMCNSRAKYCIRRSVLNARFHLSDWAHLKIDPAPIKLFSGHGCVLNLFKCTFPDPNQRLGPWNCQL